MPSWAGITNREVLIKLASPESTRLPTSKWPRYVPPPVLFQTVTGTPAEIVTLPAISAQWPLRYGRRPRLGLYSTKSHKAWPCGRSQIAAVELELNTREFQRCLMHLLRQRQNRDRLTASWICDGHGRLDRVDRRQRVQDTHERSNRRNARTVQNEQ